MHLADRMRLPDGFVARPYAGAADHPAMAGLLTAHRLAVSDPELVTAGELDQTYSHLTDCDPELDIALVELDGELVAYCRPTFTRLADGTTDLVVFTPTLPEHIRVDLFDPMTDAAEAHLVKWIDERPARYRAFARHPGPDETVVDCEAAWLEQRGYVATEWGAWLRRPHLDGIPDLPLPDGIEVRPVEPDQMHEIVAAHIECFRGEWDFSEMTDDDVADIIDSPYRDETLWQVAWDGDTIVGQVKPFINHEENEERGYRRGYTEYISTHHDYRNRGIAGALLARALRAVAERGMTEAALGVDTNNPGGAFHLYTKLGFELDRYQAVYTKPAAAA